MENDKIICGECGTENEKKYLYCKNCGVRLQSGEKTPPAGTQYSSQFGEGAPAAAGGNHQTVFIDSNPNFSHNEPYDTKDAYAQPPKANPNFVHEQPNDPNDNFSGRRVQDTAADSGSSDHNSASGEYSNFNNGYTDPHFHQAAGANPDYNPAGESNPNFNSTRPESDFQVETIGGIPYGEVAVYVGRKAPVICPKLAKMEITGSKTSWCWPTAVLGFLFGPLGAAIWFFYRKMYKIALLLVAAGVAVTICTAALTYNSDLKGATSQSLQDILGSGEEITSRQYSYDFSFLKSLAGKMSARDRIAAAIDDAVSLTTCIVTGLFALVWYKKQVVSSVLRFRQSNVDPKYYQLGLMSIGGTSGGMVALGIILLIVIGNVAMYIATLV